MRPLGEIPTPDTLNGLAKSFDLMKYDVGLLAPAEAAVFEDYGLKPEAFRQTAEKTPFSAIAIDGKKVGFLRLPSLPEGMEAPTERIIQRVSRMVKEERAGVDLLIALSDWGWIAEKEYLAQNPADIPDFLLGSGPGAGVNGRIEADGRCVWVRPYDKGRTVSEIEIFVWPDHTKGFAWKEPDNIKVLTTSLGDQYPDNADVNAILP